MSPQNSLRVHFIEQDFDVQELDHPAWNSAEPVEITKYWSGEEAPEDRRFTAELLWSDSSLYVRFTARQNEPLIVTDEPDLTKKTLGLWDRDVCEIFIAPDDAKPNEYFEFEVAPTGEWVDLRIEWFPDRRITDANYSSHMQTAARIESDKTVSAIKILWQALGKTPEPNQTFRGNLYRCIGTDPTRGYLAWQPTLTDQSSFHLPNKFGNFVFAR
jgi:hypothetical protein